jgi:CRISPR-associated protein Cas2
MEKQFIVVSYDISNDRRRTKVMKALRDFGSHVQYSVFECRLEKRQIQQLKQRLALLIDSKVSVRIYYLCKDDVARTEFLGRGDLTPDDLFYLH